MCTVPDVHIKSCNDPWHIHNPVHVAMLTYVNTTFLCWNYIAKHWSHNIYCTILYYCSAKSTIFWRYVPILTKIHIIVWIHSQCHFIVAYLNFSNLLQCTRSSWSREVTPPALEGEAPQSMGTLSHSRVLIIIKVDDGMCMYMYMYMHVLVR